MTLSGIGGMEELPWTGDGSETVQKVPTYGCATYSTRDWLWCTVVMQCVNSVAYQGCTCEPGTPVMRCEHVTLPSVLGGHFVSPRNTFNPPMLSDAVAHQGRLGYTHQQQHMSQYTNAGTLVMLNVWHIQRARWAPCDPMQHLHQHSLSGAQPVEQSAKKTGARPMRLRSHTPNTHIASQCTQLEHVAGV